MKNGTPEIIVGAGFGSSGLSALMDLLDEVEGFYTTPQEFAMFNDPDGLISLESALIDNWSIFQGNVAIRRFKKLATALSRRYIGPYPNLDYTKFFGKEFNQVVDDYVDSLVNIDFIGLSYGVDSLVKRQLNQRVKMLRRSRLTNDKMYVANNLTQEEFIELTQHFVKKLAKLCLDKYEKTSFVFDEGFVSLSLNKVLRYLPDSSKVIVMVRDPRDVYAELKKSGDAWMFQPNKIEDFIAYQNAMFKRWEEQKSQVDNSRFLQVRFDDLIVNYQDEKQRIFEFLSIEEKRHISPQSKLNPNISSENVGRWKRNLTALEIAQMNEGLEEILNSYNWL